MSKLLQKFGEPHFAEKINEPFSLENVPNLTYEFFIIIVKRKFCRILMLNFSYNKFVKFL